MFLFEFWERERETETESNSRRFKLQILKKIDNFAERSVVFSCILVWIMSNDFFSSLFRSIRRAMPKENVYKKLYTHRLQAMPNILWMKERIHWVSFAAAWWKYVLHTIARAIVCDLDNIQKRKYSQRMRATNTKSYVCVAVAIAKHKFGVVLFHSISHTLVSFRDTTIVAVHCHAPCICVRFTRSKLQTHTYQSKIAIVCYALLSRFKTEWFLLIFLSFMSSIPTEKQTPERFHACMRLGFLCRVSSMLKRRRRHRRRLSV